MMCHNTLSREATGATAMGDAIRNGLNGLTRFSGRDARQTFWLWALVVFIVAFVSMVIAIVVLLASGNGNGFGPGGLAAIGFGLPFAGLLAASVARRLHDRGLSGFWGLMPVVPFIGFVLIMQHERAKVRAELSVGDASGANFASLGLAALLYYAGLLILIVMLSLKGQPGENRFGPPPS